MNYTKNMSLMFEVDFLFFLINDLQLFLLKLKVIDCSFFCDNNAKVLSCSSHVL
jgi:hypothetical protein